MQLSLSNLEDLMLQIAKERSKDSFKKLFNFYYPKAISYMLKSGLSKEEAADLTQDALLKVWKKAHLYDANKANVNTWLFTIFRNVKYDHLRKQSRDPLAVIKAEDVFDEAIYGENVDEIDSEAIYLRAQTLEMITKLSQEQQSVLYGIYREGLTQIEYAKSENIPLGTVKSRVRLAIKNLKLLMEEK